MGDILIVEDKPEVRLSLKLMLEESGHTVHEVSSGADALTAIQSRPTCFTAIITDIMMPGVDGVELMTALKIMRCTSAVLAISGGGYQMDAGQILNHAATLADGYLKKPFTAKELEAALETAFTTRKAMGT